uniref:Uncharacterized protein n=1 Tax=Cyanistes caeruleus TaxID=156563 RepID=A0A8C0U305_CYACU
MAALHSTVLLKVYLCLPEEHDHTGHTSKYTGPCGGRDCSGGCQCFPEKGSRVTLAGRLLLYSLVFCS